MSFIYRICPHHSIIVWFYVSSKKYKKYTTLTMLIIMHTDCGTMILPKPYFDQYQNWDHISLNQDFNTLSYNTAPCISWPNNPDLLYERLNHQAQGISLLHCTLKLGIDSLYFCLVCNWWMSADISLYCVTGIEIFQLKKWFTYWIS